MSFTTDQPLRAPAVRRADDLGGSRPRPARRGCRSTGVRGETAVAGAADHLEVPPSVELRGAGAPPSRTSLLDAR